MAAEFIWNSRVPLRSTECDSRTMMPLDRSNVVDVDLGSASSRRTRTATWPNGRDGAPSMC